MLDEKKIVYIASANIPKEGGVYAKIEGLLSAARELGYQASFCGYGTGAFSIYKQVWRGMLQTDAKYIFIRKISGWLNLAMIPIYLIARLQKKQIIIDIPTPTKAQIYEILSSNAGSLKRARHIIYEYLAGPIPYWCFNKIIQYGNEGAYFSFGNKQRTIMLGNGIDPDRIKQREQLYLEDQGLIRLLGVAYLNVYHGFDRVIKAVAKWNETSSRKCCFHIIGDAPGSGILDRLRSLSKDLNVENYIIIHGLQNQEYIYNYYCSCDLAVGALGLFRKGLSDTSILKIREYCMAGIPFIAAGTDSDFQEQLPFRFEVSNDESIESILNVFEAFPVIRKTFTDDDIRRYAIEHLSFEAKLIRLGLRKIVK